MFRFLAAHLEDVEANSARDGGDVGVPDLGDESDLWWVERIRLGDFDLQLEASTLVRCVGRPGDFALQLGKVFPHQLHMDGTAGHLKERHTKITWASWEETWFM